jgi:Kef-type K+ transport system membrane component KefB
MMAEWITGSLFNEVAALLVLAAAVGFLGLLFRQPLIVSFIAVGIIAGPSGLDIARSNESINLLAELGIAILLFLVGIRLDVGLIRSLGPVSLATGLGQVLFTSAFGFLICLGLGMDAVTSLYVAVALTFSSTIIIVKLLSDKREIDSLHGRIALGFLIVQDLVVVLAMIILSAVGVGARREADVTDVLGVFGSGALMLGLVLIFIRYIANPLCERLSRAPELLISFAIALAASFAALGNELGFGKELGGLLAGVALASTPFRDAIAARLAPLRDFLLLFFFIALGSRLDLASLGQDTVAAIVLSLFVLIGNPVIVLAIMTGLGYRRRTGFLAGLTVAQISEFSLIFMAMGVSIGHVSTDALGLVTLVGLITIAASTYMITYSHELYALCEPLLGTFGRNGRREAADESATSSEPYDIIMFGLGRYGGTIGRRLAAKDHQVLGIDFSPAAVRRWREDGLDAVYGDVSDPEFIASLPLSASQWVVSTIREPNTGVNRPDARHVLIHSLRENGFRGAIAVTTTAEVDAETLLLLGADLALDPFQDAADRAVELIESNERPVRLDPIDPDAQREMRTWSAE